MRRRDPGPLSVTVDRRTGQVSWSDGTLIVLRPDLLESLTSFARDGDLGMRTTVAFTGQTVMVTHNGPGWSVTRPQLLLLLRALAADVEVDVIGAAQDALEAGRAALPPAPPIVHPLEAERSSTATARSS